MTIEIINKFINKLKHGEKRQELKSIILNMNGTWDTRIKYSFLL